MLFNKIWKNCTEDNLNNRNIKNHSLPNVNKVNLLWSGVPRAETTAATTVYGRNYCSNRFDRNTEITQRQFLTVV